MQMLKDSGELDRIMSENNWIMEHADFFIIIF